MTEYIITDDEKKKLSVEWYPKFCVCHYKWRYGEEVEITLTHDQAKKLDAIIMTQAK